MKKILKFILVMNSKALYKQPLFWLITFAPVGVGVFFLGEFFRLDFSGSSASLKYFHEQTKAQFLIIAISIPLAALMARMHSTLQTEESLKYNQDNLRNAEDELIIEHLTSELNFIKNLLTVKSIDDNKQVIWHPINQQNVWALSAQTLAKIFTERENIISEKRLSICDLKIEELRIHLYSNLRYKGIPLPAVFFAGSPLWIDEYLKNKGDVALKAHIKKQIGDETKQVSLINLSSISPQWQDQTIDMTFIRYIYDFISTFSTSDFDSKKFTKVDGFHKKLELYDENDEYGYAYYMDDVNIRKLNEGASKYNIMLGMIGYEDTTIRMSPDELERFEQSRIAKPFTQGFEKPINNSL